MTHLQCDAAITIPELSNDEVCVSEQYPRLEAHMITKTEIISLGYLWDCVVTEKIQTLNIAKQ